MPIYGPNPINFESIIGDRYWIQEPFTFTGIADFMGLIWGYQNPPYPLFLISSHKATRTESTLADSLDSSVLMKAPLLSYSNRFGATQKWL